MLVSANLDRCEDGIEKLVMMFEGFGVWVYDFNVNQYTRLLPTEPFIMIADDITGDGFPELVFILEGHGIYLGTYPGKSNIGFEEKYAQSGPAIMESPAGNKGMDWTRLTPTVPDAGVGTGHIAGDTGANIIVTFRDMVYYYTHNAGWTVIRTIPAFDKMISGRFTESTFDDIILGINTNSALYLWRSESGSLELLWDSSGEGEITAMSTLN